MKRALLLVALAGCAQPEGVYYGRTVPKHGPDEIWINNSSEPEWIDPALAADSNSQEFVTNLFAGLTQINPATLEPLPDVAERWGISPDGRTYTFRLRGTTWSDGTPVTARDFEWSWKRAIDPAIGSRNASLFAPIAGAEAFAQRALFLPRVTLPGAAALEGYLPKGLRPARWEPAEGGGGFLFVEGEVAGGKGAVRDAAVSALRGRSHGGVRLEPVPAGAEHVAVGAPDERTLRVRLTNPTPYFLDLTAFYPYSPAPRHLIERLGREGIDPQLWTRPERIVSNGAYLLKEWRFRQYVVLERNPRYWDAANVRTKRIRLLEVEAPHTMMNLYRTGDLDWTGRNGNLPTEAMDLLSRYRDFHRDPFEALYFLWLNTRKPPLDDARVRRALSLAIDREALVRHVTRAGQVPTADLVPDGLAGYEGLGSPLHDPLQARRLLAQAGYPDGAGFPRVTAGYNTLSGNRLIMEALQQMWKKELGIRVALENQEWKVYLGKVQRKEFEIARWAWFGDYADPLTFLEILGGANPNNHAQWRDAGYDRLLEAANREPRADTRLAMLRQAERIAQEVAPLIPIYVFTRNYLKKPYLKGLEPNYMDRHPWKHLWIDRHWYDGVPAGEGD
jgi:ABC-type oligopeptide transport system substrate-binding subunit